MANNPTMARRVLDFLACPRKVFCWGAGVTPGDARDVFTRLRRGEPVQDGPHVGEFEAALRTYYGGLEAITFGGARMAMYALLKAMGVGAGDEVILPGYTCVVIPNALKRLGVIPVYVDVSRSDFNLEPELVERAITPRTRAILAQHTFGVPCDLEALLDISRRHDVPLIEDGAHAIGARWDGQLLGRFGYASFFSTQETKMVNTGLGGYVITADRDLAARVRSVQAEAAHVPEAVARLYALRWCYVAAVASRPLLGRVARPLEWLARRHRLGGLREALRVGAAQYDAELAGRAYQPFPTRLPNLLAYAGLLQLRRLDEEVLYRQRLAAYLEERLPALGAAVPRYNRRRARPSWVRFPFLVHDRGPWVAASRRAPVYLETWLNDPLHPRGCDWAQRGYAPGGCPQAEHLAGHMLNVPIDLRVRRADLRRWLNLCEGQGAALRAPGSIRVPAAAARHLDREQAARC